jgi:uncharacterized protein (DUF1800 family)
MTVLSAADAAHLLRRVGFGGRPADIEALSRLSREDAVDRLLDVTSAPPDIVPAALADPRQGDTWGALWAAVGPLLDRSATSPAPLLEKMTLFWHGHFVSGTPKATPALLYRQLATYRRLALGDYRLLAQAMAVEPAMLLYLDNAVSTPAHPNRNFARELLELFLLGAGNYTEGDIAATARAWTGHTIDAATMRYRFDPAQHDARPVSFFGVTRSWNGPDLIDAIFSDPTSSRVAARHIARKLWLHLVQPRPSDAVVDTLADALIASGWRIDALVRAVLLHAEFWAPTSRYALVRPPVDLFIGLMRILGVDSAASHPEWWLPRFEQVPMAPPDVAGWKQNDAWISPLSAAVRADLATHISDGLMNLDRHPFLDSPRLSPDDAVARVLAYFGVVDSTPETVAGLRAFVVDHRKTGQPTSEGHLLLVLVMLTPEMTLA